MILAIIGLWVFIISANFEFKQATVDNEFAPYKNEFYTFLDRGCPSKVKYETNYYTIKFGSPAKPDDWIGICEPHLNGFTIEVEPGFWDRADVQDRRQLIYHELSHCVIYRDHVGDVNNYMYPVIMRINPEIMINQLKNNIADFCND